MPNVLGMTYERAAELLAACNLNFEVVGTEERVTAQTPSAGESVPENDVVLIRFGNDDIAT